MFAFIGEMPPKHLNCRCVILPTYAPPPDENYCKFAASMVLLDMSKRIVIPTAEEWYGIGMLERDDELTRETTLARNHKTKSKPRQESNCQKDCRSSIPQES